MVIYSRKGHYCTHSNAILQPESNWLCLIIYMQIFKVVVFSIWQAKLRSNEILESVVKIDHHRKYINHPSFGVNHQTKKHAFYRTGTSPQIPNAPVLKLDLYRTNLKANDDRNKDKTVKSVKDEDFSSSEESDEYEIESIESSNTESAMN